MTLHPDAQRIVDQVAAAPGPPPGPIDPAQMRKVALAAWKRTTPLPPIGAVHDRTIPGPGGDIPVRVYTPDGDGPFPLLVWFHGGGWVIGSLDENDAACRTLARLTPAIVMSVDYRLAPEHRFPAAADDAFTAVRWAAEHGAALGADPRRVAVAGESAGGNLAAVCALRARDGGGPPLALQLLVSPVVGHPGDGRASYREYAEGFFMSAASMDVFIELYPRSAADLSDPYLLPLKADDLAGLAPALVITAECEVLRDEGEEYAARLQAAGVPCELVRYDGQIHGFFGLLDEHIGVSTEAHARAAGALRAAFDSVPITPTRRARRSPTGPRTSKPHVDPA